MNIKTILSILGSDYLIDSMSELSNELKKTTDWEVFAETLKRSQFAPLFFYRIKELNLEEKIPKDVVDYFQKVKYKVLARNFVLINHFQSILSILYNNHIEVMPFKGIFLCEWLYTDLALRQMSDIDLIVKECDAERVVDLLLQCGYKKVMIASELSDIVKKYSYPSHLNPLIKDGVIVELHISLSRNCDEFYYDIDDLWRTADKATLHGLSVNVMSVEYTLVTLVTHLHKHFVEENFQFTGFYDIVVLCSVKNVDWVRFLNLCEVTNSTKIVLSYFALINHFFALRFPIEISDHPFYMFTKKQELVFYENFCHGRSYFNFSFGAFNKLKYTHSIGDKIKLGWFYLFPSKKYLYRIYNDKKNLPLVLIYILRYIRRMKHMLLVFSNWLNTKTH